MGYRRPRMATVAIRAPGLAPVMSSSGSINEQHEVAGELTCISALLSLSSPKCPPPTPSEYSRPHKMPKINNHNSSAPSTPRGVTQPTLDPGSEAWVHKYVLLKRGKYQGRRGFIVGITTKKFRVRVEGVEHQLEFYPSMFKLAEDEMPKESIQESVTQAVKEAVREEVKDEVKSKVKSKATEDVNREAVTAMLLADADSIGVDEGATCSSSNQSSSAH